MSDLYLVLEQELCGSCRPIGIISVEDEEEINQIARRQFPELNGKLSIRLLSPTAEREIATKGYGVCHDNCWHNINQPHLYELDNTTKP